MKRIEKFEDLKKCERFVRFNKRNGDFETYSFCCDEPNNVNGYMYFFERWSMSVIRFHESCMNEYEFYEYEPSSNRNDLIKIKIKILENEIENLKSKLE